MADSFIIDSNGVERRLGAVETNGKLAFSWNIYGDSSKTPLFKRSDWYDQPISKHVVPWVKDQKNTSMCNAFATALAMECSRSLRTLGNTQIRLSPAPIYNAICGGVDQGSTLEAGLRYAMSNGTCPTEFADETDWQARGWKKGWAVAAKEHRVLEVWLCPTFDHIASALLAGYFVIGGTAWGNSDELDAQGFIPNDPAGGLAGGHAYCLVALAKKGNRFGAKAVNSWSDRWGANGRFISPESRFTGQFGSAWAVRSMTIADEELEDVTPIA